MRGAIARCASRGESVGQRRYLGAPSSLQRDEGSQDSWLFLRHLDEDLAVLDHAQFVAGALLDGLVAGFQVAHFGVERRIALFQLLILILISF